MKKSIIINTIKGYIFNALLAASGSFPGLAAGRSISEPLKEAVFNALGLAIVFIGITMSMHDIDIIAVVVCLVFGTLIGSMLTFRGPRQPEDMLLALILIVLYQASR